ncbi:hypothetical protein FISHEDRAFT_54786 [Fistulina hepatica ATCC 64428]|uniref:P-loop containing nucleoside triphosphate hydrolase protein n=1 Tax=Fistulina hepatica ATCC 64428 TaxID=1128425 RepID=A0A0D7AQ42_9AGAR|nr:hypothetical protein FISHEDRAFT_54786 [Fistulina hepatica ATCC 64428]
MYTSRRTHSWFEPPSSSLVLAETEVSATQFGMMYGPSLLVNWTGERMNYLCNHPVVKEQFSDDLQTLFDKAFLRVAEAEAQGKIPLVKDHPIFWMKEEYYHKYLPDAPPGLINPQPTIVDSKLDLADGAVPDDDIPLPKPNPTLLPDRFFKTLAPIFCVRNPIRMMSSWWKAAGQPNTMGLFPEHPEWHLYYQYSFLREVFDCYKAFFEAQGNADKWPVVIDGDEVVTDTVEVMEGFCEATGLPKSGISYTWESRMNLPPEGHPLRPGVTAFLGAIGKSTCVTGGEHLLNEPVLSEEVEKWTKEWGSDVAKALEHGANMAMADYEYLRQFRVKPKRFQKA